MDRGKERRAEERKEGQREGKKDRGKDTSKECCVGRFSWQLQRVIGANHCNSPKDNICGLMTIAGVISGIIQLIISSSCL